MIYHDEIKNPAELTSEEKAAIYHSKVRRRERRKHQRRQRMMQSAVRVACKVLVICVAVVFGALIGGAM